MYSESILFILILNLREMGEAAKIARGKLQGDEFMALIEVWVDEGQQ